MATMTLKYDLDMEHLNPNDEECPIFKLHSFNNRHSSFTHPDDVEHGDIAFVLSYFEHGQCRWYRNGDGSDIYNMDPGGWDTTSVAGVLTIEDREWWDSRTHAERQSAADNWLEYYTSWANGEVYGIEAYRPLPDTTCSEGATHHHREVIYEETWGLIGDAEVKDAEREVRSMLRDAEELEIVHL